MDYESIDRAASRGIIRIQFPNGAPLYLAEGKIGNATDIPDRVRRFNRLADAWHHADLIRADFPGATVDVVSVVALW